MNNAKIGAEVKKAFIAEGSIMDDGADNAWICSYEHGHMTHSEEFMAFDPSEERSGQAVLRYVQATAQACVEHALGMSMNTGGSISHALMGPLAYDYDRYLREIKRRFDPNNASDGSAYIEHEPPTPDEIEMFLKGDIEIPAPEGRR